MCFKDLDWCILNFGPRCLMFRMGPKHFAPTFKVGLVQIHEDHLLGFDYQIIFGNAYRGIMGCFFFFLFNMVGYHKPIIRLPKKTSHGVKFSMKPDNVIRNQTLDFMEAN